MNHQTYLALLCITSASTLFHDAASAADKPNILVIVSDDHGYADVGFQGCNDIPTPHLDRLAGEGVRCTSGYVSHPFCSPTRAGLMTGRYQQRFGHENNPFYDPVDHKEGLPMSEKLLPEFLGQAGYKTGWIGKWHLGAATEFRPENRGFSETFGFIGGGHKFLNWQVNVKNEYTVPVERNGMAVEVTEHLTTAFGHEAADFVTRHKSEPWFLYLAFNAPHTPHEPTEERLARFASIENLTRRKYAAQVSLMDDAIGETLDALRSSGQEDNTLVFFFSDNGGPITVNGSSNDPLRGAKGDVYEGGMRVPFVVKWSAKLPAGGTYDLPVSSLDVFATSLGVAGVTMPANRKYDSVNLIPHLSGDEKSAPHDQLFWRTTRKLWAVRSGDSKLVRQAGSSDELYNLQSDIGETNSLQATRPDDASQLAATLDAWDKEMVPPAFSGPAGRTKQKKAKTKVIGK
ncbi:MAG: sulfatase-like hydrolase/transferase [Planctomycetota bacterium]|nr:sulfatase-like hydrolase/transferase [Planctomycetota bacterium]